MGLQLSVPAVLPLRAFFPKKHGTSLGKVVYTLRAAHTLKTTCFD